MKCHITSILQAGVEYLFYYIKRPGKLFNTFFKAVSKASTKKFFPSTASAILTLPYAVSTDFAVGQSCAKRE